MHPVTPSTFRLHTTSLLLSLGTFTWGYNIGILASILSNNHFQSAVGPLTTRQFFLFAALLTATYYIGTFFSYLLLAHPLADRLGRRNASLVGMAILCLGQTLQASAYGRAARALVLTGRLVSGAGTGVVSTSVPLYQAELAPARDRGRLVVLNHTGFVAGLATGFWVGWGVTYWAEPEAWRVQILVAFVPAGVFVGGLFWLRDSPRWLVQRGRSDEALWVLRYYREGRCADDEVRRELEGIERVVADTGKGGKWTVLFTDRGLRARLWRAGLLQFMAQMCGAAVMKYYLPDLLKALGLDRRAALMVGGIESTLKIGCSLVEMAIIDRVGRRVTLTGGAAVMALAMLINGMLPQIYPGNTNKAADWACVVFIFIYAFGYSLGFGSTAWVYGSEIFPTAVRARGLSFAASCGSIGSILVAHVWPIGFHYLGSKVYFFFVAVNLGCLPVIWLLYPETKGIALEDMDFLFVRKQTKHAVEGNDVAVDPDASGPLLGAEDVDRPASGDVQRPLTSHRDD